MWRVRSRVMTTRTHAAAILATAALLAGCGDSIDNASTPSPPQPASAVPVITARSVLEDSLTDKHARVQAVGQRVMIAATTPEGGFEGASTKDLNRAAGSIFTAVYGDAQYHRSATIVFRGGLVNTRTGRDLPDAKTGLYEISGRDAAAIDWTDEDALAAINWSNYRVFAHPALKQDG